MTGRKRSEPIDKLDRIERLLSDHTEHIKALWKEATYMRKRMGQFFPERRYCPQCKALLHKHATKCNGCGELFGKQEDPKAGLPR